MCLDHQHAHRLPKKRDMVIGYKILRRGWRKRYDVNGRPTGTETVWRSEMSSQAWEFGVPVDALPPGRTRFKGAFTNLYKFGIHAYKNRVQCYLNSQRVVKVLLFGVTCKDRSAYVADSAMIIDTLDNKGKRIPWDIYV